MISLRNTVLVVIALAGLALAQTAQPAASGTRPVGTIKAIAGNSVTLTTDAGADITVVVPESARLLHVPDIKAPKQSTPITLTELAAGDRMMVMRGTATPDGKSVTAASVVIMKKAEVERHKEQEREDWNRRGIGGLVNAVDPGTGTVTLATSAAPGAKTIAVKVAKEAIVRRYAPDSIRFDDAKISTLDQVKPGDQLRARGNRSGDGAEFAAEEIVSGSFRNLSGVLSSIDATKGLITVTDLATKKPFVVKITADSQVRKLPPMVAQGIAMRLRGGSAEGQGQGTGERPNTPVGARPDAAARPEGTGQHAGGERPWGANGAGPRRPPDMQQMLNRMTQPVTLADFQKGDAVMIVTTQGTGNEVTAITLLAGVEPILTAPNSNRATMLLSPWNLGGGGGGETE